MAILNFTQIFRPTSHKASQDSVYVKLTHNLRNISRTSPTASTLRSRATAEDGSASGPAWSIVGRLLVILIVIGAILSFFVKQSEPSLPDGVDGLEKQLKNQPGNANLHLQMGLVWEKKFLTTNDKLNFERAKQEVQIAQQLDPTNIFALKLARHFKQEDLSEAQKQIAETKKILEERPDYLEAWQKLAILYEQIGEKTLAQEARDRAAQINSLTL